MIVWVSGLMKTAAVLRACVEGIGDPADNIFWSLPGHGDTPPAKEISIAAWAESLAQFVARYSGNSSEIHVVGESLGGTVALALAHLDLPKLRSIVLVDTPLAMSKQWALQIYLRAVGRENPEHAYFHQAIAALFGVMPAGIQEERNYYPLLEGLARPGRPRLCALCSDLPLQPPGDRPVDPMPSTNDERDRHHLKQVGAEIRMISGPHNLLEASTDVCKTEIQRWLLKCQAMKT